MQTFVNLMQKVKPSEFRIFDWGVIKYIIREITSYSDLFLKHT